MTDAQFGVLISTLVAFGGGLVGVIKWSVSRLTSALDNNTKAHLDSVKAMTEMSTKLDFVYRATGKVEDFIKEEISQNYDVPPDTIPPPEPRHRRMITPRFVRPKTEPGEKK